MCNYFKNVYVELCKDSGLVDPNKEGFRQKNKVHETSSLIQHSWHEKPDRDQGKSKVPRILAGLTQERNRQRSQES